MQYPRNHIYRDTCIFNFGVQHFLSRVIQFAVLFKACKINAHLDKKLYRFGIFCHIGVFESNSFGKHFQFIITYSVREKLFRAVAPDTLKASRVILSLYNR